jgi:O-antigen/teichoic acid export membrane protein
MLNDLKVTSKHTFVYALGNIATKAIGIILIPLYTDPKFISQTDFGELAILEATAQILTGILAMAMTSSIQRWYWDKALIKEQKSIFFSSLAFLVTLNIPVLLLLTLNAGWFSQLIFHTPDYSYLLKLTFATAGIRMLNNQIKIVIKLRSKPVLFSSVEIVKLTSTLLLTIFFVVQRGKGLDGIWEATLIGELIALVLMLRFTIHNIILRINTQILKEMLIYGYPLMLSAASAVILSTTDRYMIHFLVGPQETAIYSLGFRFANALQLVLSISIMSALTPLRMKKINDPDNHRFYAKTLTYVSFAFVFCLLILSLFSLEALKIVTKSTNYWAANGIIPILSYAFMFTLMRQNLNIGLVIRKKTKKVALLVFTTTILNFGLNALFVPLWDSYGASLATLLSQMIFCVMMYWQSQKVYPIKYELNKLFIMVIVSAAIVVSAMALAPLNVWIRLPIKLGLLVLFPFILYFFNFYEPREIEIIKRIMKTWYNPMKLKENFRRFLNSA